MVTDVRLSSAGVVLAGSLHPSDGQGSPTVLYAHGFGQTRRAWSATAAALAAHGHAGLSFDARGHGGSGRNAEGDPYTGHQFTDDLIVLAGEQPRPPVLVAASMGGLFGLLA
jgi:pimeloyl-ACP methyl ester carboxylesterase